MDISWDKTEYCQPSLHQDLYLENPIVMPRISSFWLFPNIPYDLYLENPIVMPRKPILGCGPGKFSTF